jgi:peptidoglycan hydrolase CwlO-like protein
MSDIDTTALNTDTSVDSTPTTPLVDAETLDATQNLIIRLTQQLEDLQKQQRDLKEMLKNIFDNDDKLQQAQQIVDEQSKEARSRKTEISQTPQAIELKSKVADLSEDLKMVMESLNTHLLNYYQLTGSKAVDFPGGEEREMVIRARLRKTAPKNE